MAHDQHDCDVYAGKRHVPSDDYHHHEDRGRVPRSEEKVASRQRKSCIHLRMWDFFGVCGANGNLACIILVIASKLRFNGSYSDELRSPHRLEICGDPNKGGPIPGHAQKRLSRKCESLFCGANGNRTSDTRIFSPLLYQLSYGTSRRATIKWLPERKTLVSDESECKGTAFF